MLIDECLGAKLVPDALRAAGARVELLREHYPAGTEDRQWLAEVGSKGWVLLTKDNRIRRRPNEIAALADASVRAFVLAAGNLSGENMAGAFVRALPAMMQYVRDFPAPFVATVAASGRVSMLYTSRRLTKRAQRGPNSPAN